MEPRARLDQLAERLAQLAADIRDELAEASALRTVGVLSYLEEVASLLDHVGLRMEWWFPGGEPTGDGLTDSELYAAVRYVASNSPSLAPALTWAICSAPDLVAELSSAPPAPGELAALADLDEAIAAIVAASPAGFRRSGQVWQKLAANEVKAAAEVEAEASAGRLVLTAAGVARSVTAVAKTRPDLVPACLWLIVRRPASRLAVGAYTPEHSELIELGDLFHLDGRTRRLGEPS